MLLIEHSPPAQSTHGLTLENGTPNHSSILRLNDDCLLEVFSHLSIEDLCAVKDCSRRFSDLADSVVRSRWRNKRYDCDLEDFNNNESEVILALAKFGRFVSHLCVRSIHLSKITVENLGVKLDYCTSLEQLRLQFVDISLLLSGQCKILQNITNLYLDNCHGNNWQHAKLVKICTELKNLSVLKYGRITKGLAAINSHANIENIRISGFFLSLNELENMQRLEKLNELFVYLNTFWIADDDIFKGLNDFKKLKRLRIYSPIAISNAQLALATNYELKSETKPLRDRKYKYKLTRKNLELDFD